MSCGGIGISIERTNIGMVLYRSNTGFFCIKITGTGTGTGAVQYRSDTAPLYRPAKTATAYSLSPVFTEMGKTE